MRDDQDAPSKSKQGVPHTAEVRRAPSRARGQRRVAQILDAAEQLFAEVGYDATTTNLIAARAQIPIGSVYQFFGNKEAVLHAVAERYKSHVLEIYDSLNSPDLRELPLSTTIGRLLDALMAFGGEHLGFTRAVLQPTANPQMAPAVGDLHQAVHKRFAALLLAYAPHIPPDQCAIYARACLTAMNALLGYAIEVKYAVGWDYTASIFQQTRIMLTAYLESVLEGKHGSDR